MVISVMNFELKYNDLLEFDGEMSGRFGWKRGFAICSDDFLNQKSLFRNQNGQ